MFKRGNKFGYILPVILVMSFYGCTKYEVQVSLELNDEWNEIQILEAEMMIQDTSKRYQIGMWIDHLVTYSYQNIYIFTITSYPDGTKREQIVPIDLADKQGRWYGKCKNSNCRVQIILQDRARFDQLGAHNIQIQPHLRMNPVPGIREVGFFLRNQN